MYKVVLSDGTVINNCLEGTTSDHIVAYGSTNAEAAAAADLITSENSDAITVLDENDKIVVSAGDLVLLPGATLSESGEGFTCTISLRHKTHDELVDEQIAELQEVVIDM